MIEIPICYTRKELARRTSDGIEVTLFWKKPTNRVTVEVVDTRDAEAFELEVDGSDALDAFHHPFAYAASEAARSRTSRPNCERHTGPHTGSGKRELSRCPMCGARTWSEIATRRRA